MRAFPAAIAVVCAALFGCHKDPASSGAKPKPGADSEKKDDAPSEAKPVVDPKIANAVAAAEKQAEAPGSAGKVEGAPPSDGILGTEAAARELAPGSPAALVLGAEGSAPRLRLGSDRLVPGASLSGKLELAYRSGGSVMPTLDIAWKSTTSSAAEETNVLTRFRFVSAAPAATQPGRLPDEARAEIRKLEGTSVDVLSTPRGALSSVRVQMSGKNRDLEPFVQSGAEALSSVALVYPDVPVGVGAYWMIKSREQVEGSEVLAYRMVKLTELGTDTAKLTVATRRYLVNPSLDLEGLPPHRVRQFQGDGTATLSLHIGAPYPSSAEIQDHFMALLSPNERPTQSLPVQSELTAKFSVGR